MKINNSGTDELFIKELQKLKNIGPACAQKLVQAGITTEKKLKEIGAKEALVQMFLNNNDVGMLHPCFCYALEGAITNISWNQIPEERKEDFKQFVRDLKKSL